MSERLEVLRVKRKRDQDPIQGLILENNNAFKRSKKNSFFFKFARTELEQSVEQANGPLLVIDETKKLTVVAPTVLHSQTPQAGNDSASQLPPEFLSMIQEQAQAGGPESRDPSRDHAAGQKHKRPVRRLHHRSEPIEAYNSSKDYVYDIYLRGAISETSKEEQLHLAHFTYDEEMFNFVDDELEDSEGAGIGDEADEDSNAEDYYQNDYPEDEDNDQNEYLDAYEKRNLNEMLDNTQDLIMSDDEDDNFEILHNKRRFSTAEYRTYKAGTLLDTELELGLANDVTQEGFDNLYSDIYGGKDEDRDSSGYYEGPTSFLDDGRVTDEDEDELELKRNIFFKTDQDDDLAIHRDRIFGRLERMIEKRE